jgi:hypothetical protein
MGRSFCPNKSILMPIFLRRTSPELLLNPVRETFL